MSSSVYSICFGEILLRRTGSRGVDSEGEICFGSIEACKIARGYSAESIEGICHKSIGLCRTGDCIVEAAYSITSKSA